VQVSGGEGADIEGNVALTRISPSWKDDDFFTTGADGSDSSTTTELDGVIPKSAGTYSPSTSGVYQYRAVLWNRNTNGQMVPVESSNIVTVTVVDTTPPAITFIQPAVDEKVSGASVQISATLTDLSDVLNAKVYIDDTFKGNMTKAGDNWTYSWNATGTAEGYHTIKIIAQDNSPSRNEANATRRIIANYSLPSVSIAKPAVDGEYVSGTVAVKAYAHDPSGINVVKLYVDDIFKGDMTIPQGADYYTYNWNTTGTTPGNHVISVKAIDQSPMQNENTATRSVYAHPSVTIDQISFTGDHTLWNRQSDVAIARPQWTASVTKPIAYTISSTMTSDARLTSSTVTGSVNIRYAVTGTWSDTQTYSSDVSTTGSFPRSLSHTFTARNRAKSYSLSQQYTIYVRKSNNSDWAQAGTVTATHQEVFLTFNIPISPWGATSATPPVTRTCWSRVLKKASDWLAAGIAPDGQNGYTSTYTTEAYTQLAEKAYTSSGMNYDGLDSHYQVRFSSGTPVAVRFSLWDFMDQTAADCQDMSLWWEVLCHSVGLSAQAQRIGGPFGYQSLDPVGTPSWNTAIWNFHHVGMTGSVVYDPCIRIMPSAPYVPTNMTMSAYKSRVFDYGTWDDTTYPPFVLGAIDLYYGLPSEVD